MTLLRIAMDAAAVRRACIEYAQRQMADDNLMATVEGLPEKLDIVVAFKTKRVRKTKVLGPAT